jgi:hypothetical protein
MRENTIEAKFKKWCTSNGIYSRKWVSPGVSGVPDRILAKNGKVIFLELKTLEGSPSALQLQEHKVMKFHGLKVFTSYGLEDAIKITTNELIKTTPAADTGTAD